MGTGFSVCITGFGEPCQVGAVVPAAPRADASPRPNPALLRELLRHEAVAAVQARLPPARSARAVWR